MKTKNEKNTEKEESTGKKLNRKAAISKAGFIAISAATTMMLLKPMQAHAISPSAPAAPDSGGGGGAWIKRTPGG